jgi:DNA-binding beta-propeller fold protein YncE
MNGHGYCFMLLIAAYAGHCVENPENSPAPPGVIFEVLALNRDIPTPQWPKYRSAAALVPSPDSQCIYVAEQTAKRISVVHLASKTIKRTIQLPNEVTGVAVAPNGMLYATCSSDWWPSGMVCEIDASAGRILRRIPAGHGARSPVVSPDGRMLYTCNQYDDEVHFIDIAQGTLIAKLSAGRQPFSCALTPDGSVLVVADCLPDQNATDSTIAAKVRLITTSQQKVEATISLPAGSHSVFGAAVSPDGAFAFVTHLIGMHTLPATAIEGGWVHTNNFAVIDIKNGLLLNDFTLDDAKLGAANPWGIACANDNSVLCVAHAGSNELTVIDMKGMMKAARTKSDAFTSGKGLRFFGCSHDFSALAMIKDRLPVAGKGPRCLAIIGHRAYTIGYFGDTTGNDHIEIFDLAPGKGATRQVGTISLGRAHYMNATRKGEHAFSDGTLCHEAWQSCFSCHPFARADGLNWILSNEIGSSPKNAKSMLYSWWTPPTQWTGKRASADVSVRMGFKNSLLLVPTHASVSYIDTFLMRIKPVPSPFLVKGYFSPQAENGRRIFCEGSKRSCIVCHKKPLFTDMGFHSSRISQQWDLSPIWDTPSIIEAWREAPYGHLGSFESIGDMIRFEARSPCAGNGSSESDFSDLIRFVLSL